MNRIICIACIAVLVLSGCNSNKTEQHEDAKFVVTTPLQTDTLIYQEYVCQIRSIQHIELRALEKGYLQKVFVDEGQLVKKGQLLFQLMPAIYQAEAKKSEAEVQFAEIEYQNTKNLTDSNVVSKNELALSKAKLEKAKAELSLAKSHLGFTTIKAPFDGIVGRFNDVRLGSLVDEGDLITTLSDNSKMWVYFNVPEAEYLNHAFKKPQSDVKSQSGKKLQSDSALAALTVKLKLANNNLFEHDGVVETTEADFNNETGNIAYRATFKNTSGLLRNGETGNIMMPIRLKNALLVPQKATFEILDKKYVYVVDANNVVRSREISIGAEMAHLYCVVKGLGKSDKVLVEGLRKVENGKTIHVEFVEMPKILAELRQLHAE
jgi:membrane fusion protein (multidrug efflux system)